MALYEIRTFITRSRLSLISFGDFPDDLAAILAGRALLRKGESFEVRRGAHLVYRIGPPPERKEPPLKMRR